MCTRFLIQSASRPLIAHLLDPSSNLIEDGSLRSSVWTNVLGSGYIATALKLAAAADP